LTKNPTYGKMVLPIKIIILSEMTGKTETIPFRRRFHPSPSQEVAP
jgi:hypothetical protein